MKDQIDTVGQQKHKVLDVIRENDGEIIVDDSTLIKAIFPDNQIEQAVKAHFIITDRLNQKAELYGGKQLTIFI